MVVKIKIKDVVYDDIKKKILAGNYGPDDRIVDLDVAEQMSVSRMPVREALLQLQTEGYLRVTTRGFALRQFSLREIEDIFDIRSLLEPYAAKLAVEAGTPELIEALRARLEDGASALATDSISGTMDANRAFRSAWLAIVSNERLIVTINHLQDHIETVRLATLKFKQAREASHLANRQLLEAFEQKNGDLAMRLVKADLANALHYKVFGAPADA
jgi:DNA-binding GntR family transcriptional regulator